MIGVAFAIRASFGTACDVERIALRRAAVRLVRHHPDLDEGTLLEDLAGIPASALRSPGAARAALAALLPTRILSVVSPQHLEAMIRSEAADATDAAFRLDDDAVAALATLRELNVPRAALACGWPGIDQRIADAAGFDGALVTADADDRSLTIAALARVAQALLLPADRIYFVGTDARSELQPALVAGMHTVRLARDSAAYPVDLPQPEFTVGSLTELLDVLRAPYTRGVLGLRHILRSAAVWREGHFLPTSALSEERLRDEDAT